MSNVNEAVVRYIAVWNERDAGRRRDLVGKTWSDDGSYIDAHRRGTGHENIDAMIHAAQEQFPGYRLRLTSGIETHNGYCTFQLGGRRLGRGSAVSRGNGFRRCR
jgi:hypothetical protein